MPSYSGSYNPAVGPIIQVSIMKLDPKTNEPPIPRGKDYQLHSFNALIDTGASATCISPKVAQAVQLEPIGKSSMVGATGEQAMNQYIFGVAFINVQSQDPDGAFVGGLQVVKTTGMEFAQLGASFDVLLGRDVICKGAFSLSFDGHFILSI